MFAAKNIKSKQASQESERQRVENAHTRTTHSRSPLQHEGNGDGCIAEIMQVKSGKNLEIKNKRNLEQNICVQCFSELAEECDNGVGGRVSAVGGKKYTEND